MSALLDADNLTKSYPSGAGHVDVLCGCSLQVVDGERVAIIGASGVGKSTLLHLLAGLDRPDSGMLRFQGQDLESMSEAELSAYRNRHIGMVFQFYHLLPELSALENVLLPLLIAGERDQAADRAVQLLGEAGLAERVEHFPSQLSGGERQRVALARALACRPSLLLADEPTGNLDHRNGMRVMEVIDELHRLHRTATVMVTHNPELAAGFDRVLEMEPGGLLQPLRSASTKT